MRAWQGIDAGQFVAGPLRYFAAFLALSALATWVISAVHNWELFTPRAQRVNIAVGGLLFMLAIGLVEAAKRGLDPAWAVIGIAFMLAALLGALMYPDRPA